MEGMMDVMAVIPDMNECLLGIFKGSMLIGFDLAVTVQ
jgi:hypothetical protein